MSYLQKAKFLGLVYWNFLKGDIWWDTNQSKKYWSDIQERSHFKGFRNTTMPHGRKRKAKYQRRGAVKKRYKRSRRGFKGKGLGKKKGGYRTSKGFRIPRSRALFPAKIIVPMHYHETRQAFITNAAGAPQSIHWRMGSIFDPLLSGVGGSNRTTEYDIMNRVYQKYVVKSCFVNLKLRYKKGNTTEILRVWLYNDNQSTTIPTVAKLEQYFSKLDNNNRPMKWKHITKEKNMMTMKMNFHPYTEVSDGRLIEAHGRTFAGNPTDAHNIICVVEEPERTGTAGVAMDVFITYKVILYDPVLLTQIAAPE